MYLLNKRKIQPTIQTKDNSSNNTYYMFLQSILFFFWSYSLNAYEVCLHSTAYKIQVTYHSTTIILPINSIYALPIAHKFNYTVYNLLILNTSFNL